MLIRNIALLGLSLSLSVSANAALTTYTSQSAFTLANGPADITAGFELTNGSVVNDQYSGLDFNSNNGGTPRVSAHTPKSGSSSIIVNAAGGVGHGGGGMEIVFDSAASAFSIQVGGLHPVSFGATQFEAFDLGNSSLGQVSLNPLLGSNPEGYLFFGVSSSEAIGSVRLSAGSGDFIWFDDVSVVTAPSAVPLPAAAWLFISALGGLVVAKRKQLKT